MAGWGPVPDVLPAVQAVFTAHGITLHFVAGVQNLPPLGFGPDPWTAFHALKQANFAGGSGPASNAYLARLLAYRFAVFGVSYGATTAAGVPIPVVDSSGLSEILGNDTTVTLATVLGGFSPAQLDAVPGNHARLVAVQAGTLLHEFGHALGLSHVGPVNWDLTAPRLGEPAVVEFDPGYRSVMNYRYQGPGIGFRDPMTGEFVSDPNSILNYSEAAPNEWGNLWFPFQESGQSLRGGDQTTAPIDTTPNVPPSNQGTTDLTLTVSDAPDPVAVGRPLTYTLTVRNVGNAATGVLVSNPLPAGVTFISASPSQGTFSQANGVLSFQLGTLASNSQATIQLVVSPTAVGSLTNVATVAALESDSRPADNRVETMTIVQASTLTPTEQFIVDAYQRLLNVAVDPNGLSFWTGVLGPNPAAQTRSVFVQILERTEPGRREQLNRMYRQFLGRDVDEGGRVFWTDLLNRKLADQDAISAFLVASPEFLNRGTGSVDDFVSQLFVAAMGRVRTSADPAVPGNLLDATPFDITLDGVIDARDAGFTVGQFARFQYGLSVLRLADADRFQVAAYYALAGVQPDTDVEPFVALLPQDFTEPPLFPEPDDIVLGRVFAKR